MMQGTRRGVSVHYLPAILLLVHALCGSVDGKREIPIGECALCVCVSVLHLHTNLNASTIK